MKVSKAKAAEHRARIVTEASRLFRARGFDGVGVAEIMQAAGLTHGGFYGHFASKDALAAEACAQAFAETAAFLPEGEGDVSDLLAYLDGYLSARHRDRPATGCAMAAYGTEVPRQEAPLRAAFADGVEGFAAAIEARLPGGASKPAKAARRARALAILSAMIGGLTLARATAKADPALSAEILAGVRGELVRLLAAPG